MKPRESLDPATVEALERFLRQRQAQLIDAMRRTTSQRRSANGNGDDGQVTPAVTSFHEDVRAALADRQLRALAEIEAALARLDRGEYGLCRDCGTFIGLARLSRLPFAWRCSRCQSRFTPIAS